VLEQIYAKNILRKLSLQKKERKKKNQKERKKENVFISHMTK
jgi:hypothetical protein